MYAPILETNGLSVELLEEFAYPTKLGVSLKNTLRHFDKEALLEELFTMADALDEKDTLAEIALDYRVKSYASISQKYDRYATSARHVNQIFNDTLGFRAFCDDYSDVLRLRSEYFRIADLSIGKAIDDGYRGVHVYYEKSNFHYPIEIQFNTMYDRQLNNWLHDYLYKKDYPEKIGRTLRQEYESGNIRNEKQFEEVLKNVLSCCQRPE